MALQPPVIAHQAASSGLSRYSPKGCRCVFVQTSAPLCFHVEKFQLASKGQSIYCLHGQGRILHPSGVALAQPSQTFSAILEGAAAVDSAGGDDVLKESGENALIQVEQNEQGLPSMDAGFVPQEAPSTVKGLSEPSNAATIDFNSADASGLGANPPQPDAKLPDLSPNLETLRSNTEESINAATSAADSSQEATNTATDSLSTNQFKSAKEAYEAMLSGTQDAKDQDSSIDALSEATQSLADGISEAKSAVVNGFTKVQSSIQSSIDSAILSVKSTYDNINGSIVSSFKDVTGLDEKTTSVLESRPDKTVTSQESLMNILSSPFQLGTPVNNALKEVVTAVENITGKVLVGAGELVAKGYTSSKEVLPMNAQVYLDEVEKKVTEISGPIQAVFQQVYTVILDAEKAVGINPENPIIPIFVIVAGSVSVGILYRQLRYGGYSGDLAPTSALDLLKEERNIVLVDIRPEGLRESEGIPDLRRQARFKAANVEQFKVQGMLQRMLNNAADAEAAITAAAIRNLRNVQRNTKVILLDADGSQSKSVARALKKAGIKMPYRIDGGFRAWEANGLRVKQAGPETPLTILKEETEAILDEVNPTPSGIAAASLGVFAGIYALIEWEKTLQFLGLVCICQVVYTRLNSYDSVDDAKNDLKFLLRPFTLATQGIVWATGALEPSKLQLATSPSTSAVQDRVLQAAAKHGPLPSEYDQEQQEAQLSEESISKGSDDDPVLRD